MIKVIIAQEEEGGSEDWVSYLDPWLWEVVTERVVRANGLAYNQGL